MNNEESLFIDKTTERIIVTDSINYIHARVISNERYTISGNLYLDKDDTERKVLLIMSFENMVLSKEISLKYGFSYSQKYGTFKYLTNKKNNQFSFTFTVPKNVESMTIGIRKWYNKYDTYISSELILTRLEKPEVVSSIIDSVGSIGSCLSNIVVNRMIQRFGGKKLFHVYRNRSDQFFHYHIKKDKKIIPRSYIEDNLKVISKYNDDPNFVSSIEMLDNQYEKIGKHDVGNNESFFDILKNEKLDIIVLDNYIDMGTILSYPKKMGYETSAVFLRKYDYSNYDDFFTFGEKLSTEDSILYFNEMINYLRELQPSAVIYFLHYPYNTYVNNPDRQIRAKQFEDMFESSEVVIVPAPIISKSFQKENNPAHFDDSIYIAYSGFIYFDYIKNKKAKLHDGIRR